MAVPNPFIAFWNDPAGVLALLAYAVLLLAFTVWTLAAAANFLTRGWTHVVWLANAVEHRSNSQHYGPEWEWSLPPKPVANRAAMAGLWAGVVAFVVALDLWAIAAVIHLLSP